MAVQRRREVSLLLLLAADNQGRLPLATDNQGRLLPSRSPTWRSQGQGTVETPCLGSRPHRRSGASTNSAAGGSQGAARFK